MFAEGRVVYPRTSGSPEPTWHEALRASCQVGSGDPLVLGYSASCQVGSGDPLVLGYTTPPSANILIFKAKMSWYDDHSDDDKDDIAMMMVWYLKVSSLCWQNNFFITVIFSINLTITPVNMNKGKNKFFAGAPWHHRWPHCHNNAWTRHSWTYCYTLKLSNMDVKRGSMCSFFYSLLNQLCNQKWAWHSIKAIYVAYI